jgi:hypothetical protein
MIAVTAGGSVASVSRVRLEFSYCKVMSNTGSSLRFFEFSESTALTSHPVPDAVYVSIHQKSDSFMIRNSNVPHMLAEVG